MCTTWKHWLGSWSCHGDWNSGEVGNYEAKRVFSLVSIESIDVFVVCGLQVFWFNYFTLFLYQLIMFTKEYNYNNNN